MSDTVCINYKFMVMLVVSLIGIFVYQSKNRTKDCPRYHCPTCPQCPECETVVREVGGSEPPIDPVREYDYRKLADPLAHPARRVSRYELPPYELKRQIDLSTQGFPDNFHLMGILVRQGGTGTENKVLKLMGRKVYERSDKYEYYALISSGNETIKVQINTPRKYQELYDDDVVTIAELGFDYKVQLYDYDGPKYYPNIF